MLANAEPGQDFTYLSQQYRTLVDSLLDMVGIPAIPLDVPPAPGGNFRGFDSTMLYVVGRGALNVSYNNRTIYTLEEGDLLLPDITGMTDPEATVYYNTDVGARLKSYPALDFMRRVFEEPEAVKVWTRLLVTYSGLMLRLAAEGIREDSQPSPGFEVYEPGEVIIREGERADYVFNMSSGVGEVSVDGVTVGRVGEGEIFGAMAALTHADRSATVTARTRCSVVKVAKEQFTDLIRSNPTTIHSLLIDMANSIVNLNEQLVGLNENRER